MDGACHEKPQFDFYPRADCTPAKTNELTNDSDVIVYHAKLTTPPVPPAEQTTAKSTSTKPSTEITAEKKYEKSTNESKPPNQQN